MIAYLILIVLSIFLGWFYAHGGGPLFYGTLLLIVSTAVALLAKRLCGFDNIRWASILIRSKALGIVLVWLVCVGFTYTCLEKHHVIDLPSEIIVITSAVLCGLILTAAIKKNLLPRGLVIWQLAIYAFVLIASMHLMKNHGAPVLHGGELSTKELFDLGHSLFQSGKFGMTCGLPVLIVCEFLLYWRTDKLAKLDRLIVVPLFHGSLMFWAMLLTIPLMPVFISPDLSKLSWDETIIFRDVFRVTTCYSVLAISVAGLTVVGFPLRKNGRMLGSGLFLILSFVSLCGILSHCQSDKGTENYKTGRFLAMIGRYHDAIPQFEKAIKLSPSNEGAYLSLGESYEQIGLNKEATKTYRNAFIIHPDFDQCYQRAVQMEIVCEEYKDVVSLSSLMISHSPEYVFAYGYRAYAYSRLGNVDKALTDFDKRIALNPNSPWPHIERGSHFLRVGKFDLVIKDANHAIGLNSMLPNSYGLRGSAYEGLGDYEHAVADYSQAIRLDPTYALALQCRSDLYIKIGRKDLAKADAQRAKALRCQR